MTGGPDGTGAAPEVREDGTPSEPADAGRREVMKWLWRAPVLALLGGGGYGLYLAVDRHFIKRRPDPTPEFDAAGPEVVAPLSSFAEVWDSAEFVLAATPAVAVRVPQPVTGGLSVGGTHLVAFTRICTHQHCLASFNPDVNAISFGFNYATTTPAITCPCHLSVFDPQRAGLAVSGPATLPLPRARLELGGDDVLATGWERPR